eukprot:TRINITY_DN14884_c0_g1_i1.p1 TRINITY_DN14884_c0_g1~~TRINITY_DN14884_c0_g1_i1.p1  ORF type:complete len:407 (+),score=50.31 TRINITY_DN14884_c0_g1_i1:127-1347(+)
MTALPQPGPAGVGGGSLKRTAPQESGDWGSDTKAARSTAAEVGCYGSSGNSFVGADGWASSGLDASLQPAQVSWSGPSANGIQVQPGSNLGGYDQMPAATTSMPDVGLSSQQPGYAGMEASASGSVTAQQMDPASQPGSNGYAGSAASHEHLAQGSTGALLHQPAFTSYPVADLSTTSQQSAFAGLGMGYMQGGAGSGYASLMAQQSLLPDPSSASMQSQLYGATLGSLSSYGAGGCAFPAGGYGVSLGGAAVASASPLIPGVVLGQDAFQQSWLQASLLAQQQAVVAQQAALLQTANITQSSGRQSGGAPPQGSWKCECGNINYPQRVVCNRSGCAKPRPDGSAAVLANHPAGSWICRICKNVNYPTRSSCNGRISGATCGRERSEVDAATATASPALGGAFSQV